MGAPKPPLTPEEQAAIDLRRAQIRQINAGAAAADAEQRLGVQPAAPAGQMQYQQPPAPPPPPGPSDYFRLGATHQGHGAVNLQRNRR